MLNDNATIEGNKHKQLRGCHVGEVLDSSLCMNLDDIRMIAHVLKRETLVMSVHANSNKNKCLVGDHYVPIRGTLRYSIIRNVSFEEDNTMCYLKDRRKDDERTYIYPNIFFKHKKGIVMCHHGIHYDAMIDPNAYRLPIKWPNNESCTIFQYQVSNRKYLFCYMCSWKHTTVE